jgi:hypothetical protein
LQVEARFWLVPYQRHPDEEEEEEEEEIGRKKKKKKKKEGRSSPSRRPPHVAGPVTAEGDVEDNLVVLKLIVDVAVALEHRRGRSPVGGFRVVPQHIRGDLLACEPPDLDEIRVPLHSVNAAAAGVAVEPVAVRVARVVVDGAAGVVGLSRRVDVAVVRLGDGAVALPVDAAAIGSVQRHVVVRLLVHAFDDVDLAVVGPVVSKSPAMAASVGLRPD